MKCIILGSTGYHPSASRQTASYFLPEIGVAFDAGTGFYRLGDYLRTSRLDIFLTHAHLDHVAGLTYLSDVLRTRPDCEVSVYGEPDKLQAVEQHLFAESLFPVAPNCRFIPIPETILLPSGGRLRWHPLRHRGGAIGFRADWTDGRSFAYISDTVALDEPAFIDFIRGVKLLLHDAYFPDAFQEKAQRTGHSTPSQVAQLAQKANVGRCVLIHTDPLLTDEAIYQRDAMGLEQAKRIFSPLEVGRDFQELDF